MKKRVLAMLLALTMIASCLPTGVLADGSNGSSQGAGEVITTYEPLQAHGDGHICEHCVAAWEALSEQDKAANPDPDLTPEWTAWDGTTDLGTLAAGHYVVTSANNDPITVAKSTLSSGDYVLCLNGKTLSGAAAGTVFELSGTASLTITDCTAKTVTEGDPATEVYKAGKITEASATAVTVAGTAVFNMYDGVFTGNVTTGNGGAVRVASGASLNIYGGAFIDNSAAKGGAVYSESGNLNIANSTFDSNETTASHGGAFYLVTTAGASVKDCVFTNNAAPGQNGGAIYTNDSSAVFDGCTFRGNSCASGGSTVHVAGGDNSHVTLKDCLVTGNNNTATGNYVGAVYVTNTTDKLTVSGATQVYGNTTMGKGEVNIAFQKNSTYLYVDALSQGATFSIFTRQSAYDDPNNYIKVETGSVVDYWNYTNITYKNKSTDTVPYYIHCDNSTNTFSGITDTANLHAHCGFGHTAADNCEHYVAVFKKHAATSTLPDSGSYYLDNAGKTVTLNGAKTISVGLNLCLNGHTIQQTSGRVFSVNAGKNLSIYDCHTAYENDAYVGGVIKGGKNDTGSAIWVGEQATLNLYGGRITDNHGASTSAENSGSAIFLRSNGNPGATFNMYGGEICENGNAYSWGGAVGNGSGNANNTVTFNMYGGAIFENDAMSGAAVFLRRNAVFNMYGGTIRNNHALGYQKNNSLTGGHGGAVYAYGDTARVSINIEDGLIQNNTAAANGGGVYLDKADLEITAGKLYKNSAKNGGGVYAQNASVFTMKDGTLEENAVTGNGGGVFLQNTDTKLVMSGGEITGNRAANGAGVLVQSTAQVEMSGGTIKENTATGSGGGMYISTNSKLFLSDGQIQNNTAKNGGGVYLYRSASNTNPNTYVEMTGGTISGNKAVAVVSTDAATGVQTVSGGFGSGVCVENAAFNMQGGQISGNGAKAVEAGEEEITGGSGGGVALLAGGTLTVTGGQISNNHVKSLKYTDAVGSTDTYGGNGGGVYAEEGSTIAMSEGTIGENSSNVSGGGVFLTGADTTMTMTGGKLYKNSSANGGGAISQSGGAFTLAGGTLEENSATSNGGGIYVSYKTNFTMTSGSIRNNSANNGGGIILDRSTGSLSGGTIQENTAANRGGGLYVYTPSTSTTTAVATLSGVEIRGNQAATDGGGIALNGQKAGNGAVVTMTGGKIIGNVANNAAGVLTMNHSSFELQGGQITENEATNNGGGIYVSTGTAMTMTGGTISNNTAKDGAGIYALRSTVTASGGEISDNEASQDGGAIGMSGAEVTLVDVEMKDNTAERNGGAIVANVNQDADKASKLTIQESKLSGNKAESEGGAIYASGASEAVLTEVEISGNEAKNGSAITAFAGSVTLEDAVITGNHATSGFGAVHLNNSGTYGEITITVKGATQIKGNTAGADNVQQNLYMRNAKYYLNANELTDGAEIWVTMETSRLSSLLTNITTGRGDTDLLNFFKSDSEQYQVAQKDEVYLKDHHDHCICGDKNCAKHEQVEFMPWTSTTSLPTKGNWYLTADVQLDKAYTTTGDLNLCLHGFTVTAAENARVLVIDYQHTASITDCKTTGTITGGSKTYGGAINVGAGSEFNLWNGTVTGNNGTEATGSEGGAVYMQAGNVVKTKKVGNETVDLPENEWIYKDGGVFNMYGGAISGNTAVTGGALRMAGSNDAKCKPSVFNMYGGTISGNTAKNGGAIHAINGSQINLIGGMITGNKAVAVITTDETTGVQTVSGGYGSGVYVENATLNLSGGQITGNGAKAAAEEEIVVGNGGGVALLKAATLTMTGGEIKDNHVKTLKYLSALDGEIETYKNHGGQGGGVYAEAGSTITLSKGIIGENTSDLVGGGVFLTGKNTAMTMAGGKLYKNSSANGGGVITQTSAAFTLAGGTVEENSATSNGGGVYVSKKTQFTMTSGSIHNNSAASGGGLYALKSTVSADGGKICNNEASRDGGAIGMSGATVTLKGVTVKDNSAGRNGGAIAASVAQDTQKVTDDPQIKEEDTLTASELVIEKCVLAGNTAEGSGGAVKLNGGKVEIRDTQIEDNTAQGSGGALAAENDVRTLNKYGEPNYIYKEVNGEKIKVAKETNVLSKAKEYTKGEATVVGGKIGGNQAAKEGGAIYAINAITTKLVGTEITGNQAKNGSAVVAYGGSVTMEDAVIKENHAENSYGAVNLNASGTYGLIQVTVKGKTQIIDNTAGANKISQNLFMRNSNTYVNANGLTDGAVIGVTMEQSRLESLLTNITTDRGDKDLKGFFTSDLDMFQIVQKEEVCIKVTDQHDHCICGTEKCDKHTQVEFLPWTSTTSLPTKGNWYLTADVQMAKQVEIGGDVNLCLNGHTVTAAKDDRHFLIKNGAEVSVTDCTTKPGGFTGASHTYGGSVNVNAGGTLNLYGGRFYGNKAPDSEGGAIYVQAGNIKEGAVVDGGIVNMYGGEISDNTAMIGGAVRLAGSNTKEAKPSQFHMYGGVISGNEAVYKVTKDAETNQEKKTNGYGGGIAATSGTVVDLLGGTVTGNTAEADGAGIYADSKSVVTIKDAKLTDNAAGQYGGAVFASGNGTVITMESGEMSGNKSNAGGALMLQTKACFTLNGGKISGNQDAKSGGGALYISTNTDFVMNGGEISGNTTTANGGGIYALRSRVTLNGGEVSGNEAKSKAGAICGNGAEVVFNKTVIKGNSAQEGGAAYFSRTSATSAAGEVTYYPATVTINDGALITENKAQTNCGGILSTGDGTVVTMLGGEISKNTAKNGGGVMTWTLSTFVLKGGKIAENTATSSGGGVYVSTNTTFKLEGGEVSKNTAKNGAGFYFLRSVGQLSGGDVSGNRAKATVTYSNGKETKSGGLAGGIYVSGSDVTLSGTNLKNNIADVNGGAVLTGRATVTTNGVKTTIAPKLTMTAGVVSGNKADNAAGILTQTDTVFYLKGGLITNNTAENSGGGIYVSTKSTMHMTGGTVTGNHAEKTGGGIYALKSTANITGGALHNNTAVTNSGNLMVSGETAVVTVKNMKIYGGEANTAGSMVVQSKGTLNVENCEIFDNKANTNGGAVFISNKSFGNFVNCKFYENTAGKQGGAVLVNNFANGSFTDCQFYENVAGTSGGAIWTSVASETAIANSTFTKNTSQGGAGAIHCRGNMTIKDSLIEDNTATDNGGAISTAPNATTGSGIMLGLSIENTQIKNNTAGGTGGGIQGGMGCAVKLFNTEITGNTAKLEGGGIWSSENLELYDVTITGNTSGGAGYALYIGPANYDGHSYWASRNKMSGNVIVKDNAGGDMYLDAETVITITAEGLGKDTCIQLTLDSGILTNRVLGAYNYEGGNQVYTITYGDRSITDPETIPAEIAETVEPTEGTEGTQATEPAGENTLLYAGVGAFAVVIAAAAVIVIVASKKKKAGKTAEEVSQD